MKIEVIKHKQPSERVELVISADSHDDKVKLEKIAKKLNLTENFINGVLSVFATEKNRGVCRCGQAYVCPNCECEAEITVHKRK